jgi:hypothetical protein
VSEDRLSAIAQAKAKIEQRAAERHQLEQQEYEAKTAKREAGKKPCSKDPEPPQAGAKDGDQVNLTDEESRIMPVSGGREWSLVTMAWNIKRMHVLLAA